MQDRDCSSERHSEKSSRTARRAAVTTSTSGRSIEVAVARLNERARRLRTVGGTAAKGVQDGNRAVSRQPENCPVAAVVADAARWARATAVSRAVKISVRCLDQGRGRAVAVGRTSREAVENSHSAVRCHPESGAEVEGSATDRGSVEATVRRLNQRGIWEGAIGPAREGVQDVDMARQIHSKNRPGVAPAAIYGGAVEMAVRPLEEGGFRFGAVVIAAGERVEERHVPGGRHLEDRAAVERAAPARRPVEIPVGRLDERGVRPFGLPVAAELVQDLKRSLCTRNSS